jgi:nitroreductase
VRFQAILKIDGGKPMQDIMQLIVDRQSARELFDSQRAIPAEDMEKILEATRWTPTAHNMQNFEIVVVDDKQLLTAISNVKTPADLTFIRENYPQLSFTEEELRRRKTGIMGTMFPKSWQTPNPDPEDILKEDRNTYIAKQIASSSAILFVLYNPCRRAPASEGDFLGIVSLGCAMENIWLMAHSLGISVHIVSSLAQKNAATQIAKLLNIPDNLVIAFSIRLGYLVAPLRSLRVRRDKDDFVHHNGFKK